MTAIWTRYLHALRTRPIRTKMITSSMLFSLGDSIAQFGIEGRRIAKSPSEAYSLDKEIRWDVRLPF